MQYHEIYFLYTTDIFRTKNDILRVFLEHECTFYDTVNMIHDFITTAKPFPYSAKFMFFGVKTNRTQQIRR